MTQSYDPALYALLHRGTPGDEAYYRDACRGVDRVLELGCGYGRLIPALARVCSRYRGLDLDPGLLKLARRERRNLSVELRSRVRLGLGDMRDFTFRERFDRILIPHSSLYCLRNHRDVMRCLRRVREHLAEDGELVFDCYSADSFHHDLDESTMTGRERDELTEVEHAGVRYVVFERARWKKNEQRLLVTYEYQGDDGSLRIGKIVHRYFLRDELAMLLRSAGFEIVETAGGFDHRRFTKRSQQLVVRARASDGVAARARDDWRSGLRSA